MLFSICSSEIKHAFLEKFFLYLLFLYSNLHWRMLNNFDPFGNGLTAPVLSCTHHIGWKLKHLKVLEHTQGINSSWPAPIVIERRWYSTRQNNMQIHKSVHLCTGKTSGFLKKDKKIAVQKLARTSDSLRASNRCFHCYA